MGNITQDGAMQRPVKMEAPVRQAIAILDYRKTLSNSMNALILSFWGQKQHKTNTVQQFTSNIADHILWRIGGVDCNAYHRHFSLANQINSSTPQHLRRTSTDILPSSFVWMRFSRLIMKGSWRIGTGLQLPQPGFESNAISSFLFF